MHPPVLLTGGTGTLGRHVAPLLREAGAPVRVLSRRPHEPADDVTFVVGDLVTGVGVDAAMAGVGTVVHCAGNAKGDDATTATLVRAARAAGVGHLVFISVVGAERLPVLSALDRSMFGYYASKRAAERVVESSGVPWTTLRATQFHDLAFSVVAAMAKLPVVPVPHGIAFQPVETGEVAARLVELALGGPAGLAPELGGPRVYATADLLRSYLRATGRRRLLVPVPIPGASARALRAGANLVQDGVSGRRTWEEYLAARVGPR